MTNWFYYTTLDTLLNVYKQGFIFPPSGNNSLLLSKNRYTKKSIKAYIHNEMSQPVVIELALDEKELNNKNSLKVDDNNILINLLVSVTSIVKIHPVISIFPYPIYSDIYIPANLISRRLFLGNNDSAIPTNENFGTDLSDVIYKLNKTMGYFALKYCSDIWKDLKSEKKESKSKGVIKSNILKTNNGAYLGFPITDTPIQKIVDEIEGQINMCVEEIPDPICGCFDKNYQKDFFGEIINLLIDYNPNDNFEEYLLASNIVTQYKHEIVLLKNLKLNDFIAKANECEFIESKYLAIFLKTFALSQSQAIEIISNYLFAKVISEIDASNLIGLFGLINGYKSVEMKPKHKLSIVLSSYVMSLKLLKSNKCLPVGNFSKIYKLWGEKERILLSSGFNFEYLNTYIMWSVIRNDTRKTLIKLGLNDFAKEINPKSLERTLDKFYEIYWRSKNNG